MQMEPVKTHKKYLTQNVLTRLFRDGSQHLLDMVLKVSASLVFTKFSRMSSKVSPEKKTLSSIKQLVLRYPQQALSLSLTLRSLPGKL